MTWSREVSDAHAEEDTRWAHVPLGRGEISSSDRGSLHEWVFQIFCCSWWCEKFRWDATAMKLLARGNQTWPVLIRGMESSPISARCAAIFKRGCCFAREKDDEMECSSSSELAARRKSDFPPFLFEDERKADCTLSAAGSFPSRPHLVRGVTDGCRRRE